MNKLSYNMTQLLNELQTYGNDEDKEKDKNTKKPKKSSKGKENKNTKTSKKKIPKGTSFHCGEDGHWKRNYPKYLAGLKEKNKGKFDLLVLEACLVEDSSSSWIVDSGATNHVCFTIQILS